MWKASYDFAMRGNAIDLAVIIGAASDAIVSSLVDDVLMPPRGGIVTHGADAKAVGAPTFSSVTPPSTTSSIFFARRLGRVPAR